MTARILVTYTSKNGSTADIASAVGKELNSAGYLVDVTDMKTITVLKGYDAIVIGGPLYMGAMSGEVKKFVGRYKDTLRKLPVAAFAVGLAPKNPVPDSVKFAEIALHESVAPLQPVAEILFAGKLDPDKVNFLMRKFLEMAKIPIGDFREWDVISTWARQLPEKFRL